MPRYYTRYNTTHAFVPATWNDTIDGFRNRLRSTTADGPAHNIHCATGRGEFNTVPEKAKLSPRVLYSPARVSTYQALRVHTLRGLAFSERVRTCMHDIRAVVCFSGNPQQQFDDRRRAMCSTCNRVVIYMLFRTRAWYVFSVSAVLCFCRSPPPVHCTPNAVVRVQAKRRMLRRRHRYCNAHSCEHGTRTTWTESRSMATRAARRHI